MHLIAEGFLGSSQGVFVTNITVPIKELLPTLGLASSHHFNHRCMVYTGHGQELNDLFAVSGRFCRSCSYFLAPLQQAINVETAALPVQLPPSTQD